MNTCIFCGEEFEWGQIKTRHVMEKHPEKIPFKIIAIIANWYLKEELTKGASS